ncbi:MAG: outer membrane beta-barrel protein [Hyphomicrobiales bacterium]|nr:outer membrane beta-barrel protein [Hyphomicrobiales bacterium]
MGLYRALAVAATAAVAFSGMARAADLLPPPPPPAPYAAPYEASDSGWYLRGDVGVGMTHLSSFNPTFPGPGTVTGAGVDFASIDSGAYIDGGVGYQFNNWFRADVTAEYRGSTAFRGSESYTGTQAGPPATYTGHDYYTSSIAHTLALVNGYVDLGTWSRLTPFVGAGLGMSYNMVSGLTDIGYGSSGTAGQGNGGGGYAANHGNFSFAWALMAGLDYRVNSNLKLELGYRYLNMGRAKSASIVCQGVAPATCPNEVQSYNLSSHDLHLGMLWTFGGEAHTQPVAWEPAPQEPIVKRF